jgi:hypothetical protein
MVIDETNMSDLVKYQNCQSKANVRKRLGKEVAKPALRARVANGSPKVTRSTMRRVLVDVNVKAVKS